MGRASHGINPVTFRGYETAGGGKKMAVSIARMHVSIGGPVKKFMPVVMFSDDDTDSEEPRELLGSVILDEEHFLEGMYHLFPIEGSMDHGDRVPASVNEELVTLLRGALTELERLGGDTKPIAALLDRYGL